jgi:hypothetical protein
MKIDSYRGCGAALEMVTFYAFAVLQGENAILHKEAYYCATFTRNRISIF